MIGNLILVKHDDFISKFIRWYTKSEFNHVGLFIDDNNIIEAGSRCGVRKIKFNYYKNKKSNKELDFSIYKVKNLNEEQKERMKNFALKEVGISYDFLQFICVGIFYIFGKLRKLEPIDLHGWICSELIAENFYEVGIKFQEDVDPDNITPTDIAKSTIIMDV